MGIEDLILRELRAQQDQLAEMMRTGTPKDYESYRELVGRISALRNFEQSIQDILSSLSRGDDPSE